MILQVAINGLGSTVVASYTAASKVEQLVTQPLQPLEQQWQLMQLKILELKDRKKNKRGS